MKEQNAFQKKLDEGRCPAIPPADYKGSQADWMIELQTRGIWDGDMDNWYGDIWIDSDEWYDILEACEDGPPEGECSIKCKGKKHHKTCKAGGSQ